MLVGIRHCWHSVIRPELSVFPYSLVINLSRHNKVFGVRFADLSISIVHIFVKIILLKGIFLNLFVVFNVFDVVRNVLPLELLLNVVDFPTVLFQF